MGECIQTHLGEKACDWSQFKKPEGARIVNPFFLPKLGNSVVMLCAFMGVLLVLYTPYYYMYVHKRGVTAGGTIDSTYRRRGFQDVEAELDELERSLRNSP